MKYFLCLFTFLILFGKVLEAQQRSIDDSVNRDTFTPRHEVKNAENRGERFCSFSASFLQPEELLGSERFEHSLSQMTPLQQIKFRELNESTRHKPVTVTLNNGEKRVCYFYDESGNLITKLTEYLANGVWKSEYRHSYTYDTAGNRLSYSRAILGSDGWINEFRFTYSFDADGNMLTKLRENWETWHWVSYSRSTYTYDAHRNMLTETIEEGTGELVNYERYTYTYDAAGNLLIAFWERWINNAWENYFRNTYKYDFSGNMLSDFSERWENGLWINYYRYTYTYDYDGNMLTYLWERFINDAWDNVKRYTYTYDADGNLLTELSEWGGSTWSNDYIITYTYDTNGNCLTLLLEDWVSGAWVLHYRLTNTYDINGNNLAELYEHWYTDGWGNWELSTYTFDEDGNCTRGEAFLWDGSAWIPNDGGGIRIYYNYGADSLLFYYTAVVSVEYTSFSDVSENVIVPVTFSVSQNFPNPFNPSTNIKFTIPDADFVTLKVYDILGREIAVLINEHRNAGACEVQFNASHLPSGTYFYRLTSGSNSETKKMLLLK